MQEVTSIKPVTTKSLQALRKRGQRGAHSSAKE